VAAIDAVITGTALSGILFNLVQYRNLSSKCVMEPYSLDYSGFYYWARYIGKNKITT